MNHILPPILATQSVLVTAEQVEKLNLRNLQDIQEIVTGLTMASTNRSTVRGIG